MEREQESRHLRRPVTRESQVATPKPGRFGWTGPAAILGLQRVVGNRVVASSLSARPATFVQRTKVHAKPQSAAYVAHPAALSDCVGVLRRMYQIVGVGTITDLRRFKTVAVGQVVSVDEPEVGRLVWTANGNWNDPVIAAAFASLNAVRWDPGQSTSPRGNTGAPGDAEQRMLSHETDEEYVVKAMAVSRPLCGDCAEAVTEYGRDNGQLLVTVVPPPGEREQQARQAAVAAAAAAAGRLRGQLDLYAGEHKVQAELINTPSITGFVGFWTNRLFNKEIPPPTIWVNAYGALAATDAALTRNDVRATMGSLIRARRQFLIAQRQYLTWKEGIEPAGEKAQVAIGVVALAAIAAVVAPAAVAAAAEAGGEVGATAAAEQMTLRIASTIAQADATMLAAETAITEAEIMAEAELETELLLGL